MKKVVIVLAKFANLYPFLFAHLTPADIENICRKCEPWHMTEFHIMTEIVKAIMYHFSVYDNNGKYFRLSDKMIEYREKADKKDTELRKAFIALNNCYNNK